MTSVCHRKTQTYLLYQTLSQHHAITLSKVRDFTNKEFNITEDNTNATGKVCMDFEICHMEIMVNNVINS